MGAAARGSGAGWASRRPVLKQNWLTVADVANLLHLSDFRVVRTWQEVLLPVAVPGLAPFCNRVLVRLPGHPPPGAGELRPRPPARASTSGHGRQPSVSVIVPARNEAGNIPAIFARTPEMGGGTELVFVEGHSSDDTYGAIERAIAAHPQRTRGCSGRPAEARGTPCGWVSPRPPATS